MQADVGLAADRQRMVGETLAEFGRIDVLVNNAGITSVGRKDLLEATEESWDAVFATNLKGPFFLAQQVAREMIRLIKAGADRPRHDHQRLVHLGLCCFDEPRRLLHRQVGDCK